MDRLYNKTPKPQNPKTPKPLLYFLANEFYKLILKMNDLLGGKYTQEEVERLLNMNARPANFMKPFNAFYKKSAMEHGPTWHERKEFVSWLIHESNISL